MYFPQPSPNEYLENAIRFNNLPRATKALSDGADVNHKCKDGKFLMHIAALNGRGYLDEAQFLIDHGADINAKEYCGWTPLHWAASIGSQEMVEFLLDHGADVDAQTDRGDTPVMLTKKEGIRAAFERRAMSKCLLGSLEPANVRRAIRL